MKPLLPGDMIEATRLTRAGRLNEAVALLQNLLRGTRAGDSRRSRASAAAIALPAPGVIELLAQDVSSDGVKEAPGARPQTARGVLDRIDVDVPALPGMRGTRRLGPLLASDLAPAAGKFIA